MCTCQYESVSVDLLVIWTTQTVTVNADRTHPNQVYSKGIHYNIEIFHKSSELVLTTSYILIYKHRIHLYIQYRELLKSTDTKNAVYTTVQYIEFHYMYWYLMKGSSSKKWSHTKHQDQQEFTNQWGTTRYARLCTTRYARLCTTRYTWGYVPLHTPGNAEQDCVQQTYLIFSNEHSFHSKNV